MRHILNYTILCLIVISCKTLPEGNYAKILSKKNSSKTISEIIKSDSCMLLSTNLEYNSRLELTDSIIQINDDGTYLSNYKLFKTYGIEGKKYLVTLYGLCDCFGYRKYMINPKLILVDKEGVIIDIKPIKNETVMLTNPYSNTLPFHIDNEWEYILPRSGEYKIIVYSDNKVIGSEFTSQSIIKWPIYRKNIKGDFMITIQEK